MERRAMVRETFAVLGLGMVMACSDSITSTTTDASANDAADVPDASDAAPEATVKDAGSDGGFDCSRPLVEAEQVLSGTPDFKVVEAVVFAAPVGTTNNDPMNLSLAAVEGPLHVYDPANLMFKAAQPHAGPYDNELLTGLAASPYKNSGCFVLSDLTSPNGIILSFNIVPSKTAPAGKSFERTTTGPVIPSGLAVDGDLYVNGALVDPNFDGTLNKAIYVYNDNTLDGFAHLYASAGETQAASPKPLVAGSYRYEMKLSHDSGTTRDVVHFVVK